MNWLNFLFPFLGLMTFAETDGAAASMVEEGAEEDSETSKDSSTKKTEGEAKSGEDGKTQEPSDEDVERGLLEAGDAIPYDRFKQFVTKRNSKVSELSTKLEDIAPPIFPIPPTIAAFVQFLSVVKLTPGLTDIISYHPIIPPDVEDVK